VWGYVNIHCGDNQDVMLLDELATKFAEYVAMPVKLSVNKYLLFE
jgi:pyruvate/2-oxoacid:ferredoxin oxidoreductase alpha subunit